MFVNVHKHNIYEEYDTSYLTTFDLIEVIYKLYSVSEGLSYSLLTKMFELQMNHQGRYCITTKNTILQYDQIFL